SGVPPPRLWVRAWRILYVRGRGAAEMDEGAGFWPDAHARAARCRARASISGRNSDGLQDTTASGTPASFSISFKLMSSSVRPSSLKTTLGMRKRSQHPSGEDPAALSRSNSPARTEAPLALPARAELAW